MFKKYFYFIVHITHFAIILLCSYIVAVYLEPIIYIIGFLPAETGNVFCVYFSIMSIFCLFQMSFRGLLQLLFSAPLTMTTIVDIISFSPCLILVGDISGYFSKLPYIPERLAPLFYLGLFIAIHLFLKLITLFTSLYGKANSRWYSLIWFFFAFLFIYTSLLGLIQWKQNLIYHRFLQVKTLIPEGINQVFTTEIPEGSFFIHPVPVSSEENCIWFIRGGNKFSSMADIFLYIIFSDKDVAPCIIPLQVSRNTWTEICLKDYLPTERYNFIISWSSYHLPIFLVRQGLVPQFSLKSLEETRDFLFSQQKPEKAIYKSIYIDGPYCSRDVTGEVVVK